MTADQMRAWGWRIPFVVGALTAVVALYLRRSLHETTTAESRANKDAGSMRALMKHPRALLTVMGLTAGGSLAFYTFTTYMQKYLVNTAHFPVKTVSVTMAGALFLYMLMQPLFGALSDRVGRRNLLFVFCGLGIVSTVPLLRAIGQAPSISYAFFMLLIALAIISFYTSISGVVKAELFPAEIRALGVGVSYAIGNAIFWWYRGICGTQFQGERGGMGVRVVCRGGALRRADVRDRDAGHAKGRAYGERRRSRGVKAFGGVDRPAVRFLGVHTVCNRTPVATFFGMTGSATDFVP